MPLNTEVDYNNVVIKGTVELGVKGERGLQGFKGDQGIQGPPVPVAHELGDDPDLAVSQKLLTDSIEDMEQANDAAVTEATHQAGLAGDSAAEAEASATEAEASANLAGEYRDNTHNISDVVNAAMVGFLHSIEYNVAGKYAAGLVLTAPNDIVRMPDGTYWGIISGTELPLTLTGNIITDGHSIREYPFASMKSLEIEVAARQAADDNLQAQLSGVEPLKASAFSPVSWHDQSIENSVTIPPNKNAWSFGPTMTIGEGQAVTVSEGSFWTIANGEVQQ